MPINKDLKGLAGFTTLHVVKGETRPDFSRVGNRILHVAVVGRLLVLIVAPPRGV